MKHVMTRREMIRVSALLAGGIRSCRSTGDSSASRSTCCNTPDLEPESLTVGENDLTIDLKKAHTLRDVGNAREYCKVGETCFAVRGGSWIRCPAYRGRTGSVFEKLFDTEVEPRLSRCERNPKYPPYPWDDDRGFRCVRREGP